MPRLYLVRHGRAAASFAEAVDPGLDPLGREQASDAARRLFPLGPLAVVTSPLQRARETSEPLAKLWQREAVIDPAVSEIPSPPGLGLAARADWLRGFMAGSWHDATLELAKWREDLIAALTGFPEDTVVFSHYVAINVAVSAALRDARVTIFHPDNCSVTIFDTDQTGLRLVECGHEAASRVN
jgi:broad specificity phosphatase PhoE